MERALAIIDDAYARLGNGAVAPRVPCDGRGRRAVSRPRITPSE